MLTEEVRKLILSSPPNGIKDTSAKSDNLTSNLGYILEESYIITPSTISESLSAHALTKTIVIKKTTIEKKFLKTNIMTF